ncbi:MAG: hypothetical protein U0904_10140 [Candidatus Nanopelagicales bacterium]|nr:hypothetical protein [Candidatus Nanopelagicales bacterium]
MSISEGSEQGPRGKRAHRVSSASQKYDIWLQLVRGEVTMAEAAAQHQVDRSVIVKLRQVAKEPWLVRMRPPGAWERVRSLLLWRSTVRGALLTQTQKEPRE